MYAGLVTDNSTGKTYLLNTNHDGTYGRMLTVDGNYNVNGKNVYITFNQAHDGSFGAITSGLSEVRASGVAESKRDSIPTDKGGSQQQTQQSTDRWWENLTIDDISEKNVENIEIVTDATGWTAGDTAPEHRPQWNQ